MAQLEAGHDATGEIDAAELAAATQLRYSADPASLRDANVYIIAVPTPVTPHKWPDLSPLIAASDFAGPFREIFMRRFTLDTSAMRLPSLVRYKDAVWRITPFSSPREWRRKRNVSIGSELAK